MYTNLAGALAGRYRIDRELGVGGMATVFLAEDIRHRRNVALKVLKPELAAVLGADRFIQEITTTAALQHPHILPLFDSGTAAGFLYYVMPFIDGETLRSKLNRETQLGIEESVRIAVAVADALDYAHRHGVIHRDIKPENILLHEGRPMVADFGIALALSAAAGGRMTETGLSLGTPHYMSPEQATAEKEISARSDIYSLASVLYEMLGGNPPHVGASAQQIIMKIVTEEAAPVTKLRKSVPPNVASAVACALEKLPADRFDSAREFANALHNPGYRHNWSSAVASGQPRRRVDMWRIGLGGLAAVSLAAAAWTATRTPADREPLVSRFAIALPSTQDLRSATGTRIDFSPDGQSFAYTGTGNTGPQLWVRRLNDLEATQVSNSDGAGSPQFSPDGKEIAFITVAPFAAKIVTLANGQVRTVTTEVQGGGLAWARDGYLYVDGGTGLVRIRPDGSGLEMVLKLDSAKGESGLAWPAMLPGDKGVLVRIRHGGESAASYSLVAVDVKTGKATKLMNGLKALYSPTGHLVWVAADGSVHAQRFNPQTFQLSGEQVSLLGGVAVAGFGSADIALSSRGDLLYVRGATRSAAGALVWVSRDGRTSRVDSTDEPGELTQLAVSPSGSHVAMTVVRGAGSGLEMPRIWVKSLKGGPTHLVSTELAYAGNAVWTPDGRYLMYSTQGREKVMRRRADGSGPEELVLHERLGVFFLALSPDGRTLLIRALRRPGTQGDILQFRIGVDTSAVPLLNSPAHEDEPAFSPDGKWLAYSSDESGASEIYVRPFPNIDAQKIQVSNGGGMSPMWSRDSNELFFLSRQALNMMSARVNFSPTFSVSRVDKLFGTMKLWYSARERLYRPYPDGSRFLAMDIAAPNRESDAGRLVFVQNFARDLEGRFAK